jgi:DNA-binding NarL/FixJ family response regulator
MRNNSVIIATGAGFLAEILRDILRDMDVRPVVTACNEDELVAGIKNRYPRLVFLENCFRVTGTEELIPRLVKLDGDLRIAVWSAAAVKPVIAARYLLAGAESYFSLRETEGDMADILKVIAAGKRYCPSDVKAVLNSATYFPDIKGKLTMRETEIVKLSITGKNNREIGDMLGISPSTVKSHKASIYRKCGGNTPIDILRYGLTEGIIRLDDLRN